ncbi:hypothetical protein F9278_16580 [Streptomyces phaeolivaceus]|uniref:Uncharacterized protein n=1 Tax=Streptomyces phaeolivaceus TaxID=2653200 RepID=A0A5P8K2R4_9ACTN|nr:hypothetical protein [Streptomyces phaeolivaceus]QFQ97563.1 hypothetical protein F9278_16580 [Streptomyces phaeolivaceus]
MASQSHCVLDASEITQAVQDLNHSVTLIAGKTTVVRLYVKATSGPSVTVRGVIAARRSPAEPALTIASVNTVTLDPTRPHSLAACRGDAGLSLNFVLPSWLTAEGPLSVTAVNVVDAVSGIPLPLTGPAGPTVWFKAGPPLRLRVLGVRYRYGSPATVRTPREKDYQALESWLRRAYPVAEVISTRGVVDALVPPDFEAVHVNAQLAALRALDMSAGGDQRTHYYGMVADSGFFLRGAASGVPRLPDPTTVASGPCGSRDFGWDFDGAFGDWYGAHELGHTLGRRHPGFCTESHDDLLNYPFKNGQLGDETHAFVGFDVGDAALGLPMTALPGERWHDVMTYCDCQWLSSYTYEGIRRRLLAEDALVSGTGPGTTGIGTGPDHEYGYGYGYGSEPTPMVPSAPPLTAAVMAGYGGSGGRPDNRRPTRVATRVTSTGPGRRAMAGPGPEGAPEQQLVSVVGTVNLTRGEGSIRFVNPVERPAVLPGPPAGQPAPYDAADGVAGDAANGAAGGEQEPTAVLRILQGGGTPPREIQVPVKLSSEPEPGADRTGLIDVVTPAGPAPEAVELVVDGRVLDTFRPGGSPPALRAARLAGVEEGMLGMDLEFDREPEPDLSYSAQVSADGGRTWQTLGVGLKEPTVQLDRGQFRPGDDVRLRITTTNGFSSTAAETALFSD